MLLNNIAWAVNSTAALPFSSVMFVLFIWALVTLPLTVLGGITGRVRTDETLNDVGGKLPKMARVIPPLPFYHKPWFTILMAGLLPFSAMNVELYYAFSAIWGHKMYTMYGMVFMMFIMMLDFCKDKLVRNKLDSIFRLYHMSVVKEIFILKFKYKIYQ